MSLPVDSKTNRPNPLWVNRRWSVRRSASPIGGNFPLWVTWDSVGVFNKRRTSFPPSGTQVRRQGLVLSSVGGKSWIKENSEWGLVVDVDSSFLLISGEKQKSGGRFSYRKRDLTRRRGGRPLGSGVVKSYSSRRSVRETPDRRVGTTKVSCVDNVVCPERGSVLPRPLCRESVDSRV